MVAPMPLPSAGLPPCSPLPSRSEHDLGEDIYDCVPCEDEGDDIYEDIIKVEVQQPMVSCLPPVLCGVPTGQGAGPAGATRDSWAHAEGTPEAVPALPFLGPAGGRPLVPAKSP